MLTGPSGLPCFGSSCQSLKPRVLKSESMKSWPCSLHEPARRVSTARVTKGEEANFTHLQASQQLSQPVRALIRKEIMKSQHRCEQFPVGQFLDYQVILLRFQNFSQECCKEIKKWAGLISLCLNPLCLRFFSLCC